MDRVNVEEIVQFFGEQKTYKHISIILQDRYNGERRFSEKPIKRFCKKHGLSPRISQDYVDEVVSNAVEEVTFFLNLFSYKLRILLGL